jgi:hypothetical protein
VSRITYSPSRSAGPRGTGSVVCAGGAPALVVTFKPGCGTGVPPGPGTRRVEEGTSFSLADGEKAVAHGLRDRRAEGRVEQPVALGKVLAGLGRCDVAFARLAKHMVIAVAQHHS